MKVAYLGESAADEAALTIFTEALLGRKTEPVLPQRLRHRGWPAVRAVLPSVIKELHYRTDAEGLVVSVDSDRSPPHVPPHDESSAPDPHCRLCQLRQVATQTLQQVRPRADRAPLKVALGLAVPAIEAWLLCADDPQVTEAAWMQALCGPGAPPPYTTEGLKERLYGTSRPSLSVEIENMTRAATRLASNLALVERAFPHGFGALATELRSW